MTKTPTGWRVSSLAELTSSGLMADGDWIESKDQDPEGAVRLIQLADVGDGVFLDRSRRYLTRENAARLNCTYLEPDDILIARMPDPIGRAAVFPGLPDPCVTAVDVCIIRPNRDVNIKWLSYSINSGAFRRSIERRTTGTTRKRIARSTLADIELAVPPLPEQLKIAQILSIWDEAIATMEQLIAALQRRKKGLMQRLLTGQVRFPEFEGAEWEEVELGQFLSHTPRKVPKPSDPYKRMGIRSHGKGTFTEIVEDPGSNAMEYLYTVKGDDLIVNITFAWEQAIAIVSPDDEGSLVSHRFPTYEFNRSKVVPEFFRYLMLTKRFLHQLDLITPGGAGRNRVMSKTDFLKLRVTIPPVEEQKRIGAVLSMADKEINTVQEYLRCLKAQKKGLMQRLLTGQVRVQV